MSKELSALDFNIDELQPIIDLFTRPVNPQFVMDSNILFIYNSEKYSSRESHVIENIRVYNHVCAKHADLIEQKSKDRHLSKDEKKVSVDEMGGVIDMDSLSVVRSVRRMMRFFFSLKHGEDSPVQVSWKMIDRCIYFLGYEPIMPQICANLNQLSHLSSKELDKIGLGYTSFKILENMGVNVGPKEYQSLRISKVLNFLRVLKMDLKMIPRQGCTSSLPLEKISS